MAIRRYPERDTINGGRLVLSSQFRQEKKALLKEHILAIHPYYSYKRMLGALVREGIMINVKRVRRLMRELGIHSVIHRKRLFYEQKASVIFPNLLNREFGAHTKGTKLVTDITYVRIGDGFAYLSSVLDLYNNEIVAWSIPLRNDLNLVHSTMDQLTRNELHPGVLLYSDQGLNGLSPIEFREKTAT